MVDNHVKELCDAAYVGDVIKLQRLLADPIYTDKINHPRNLEDKYSPLILACQGLANAETVRLLLNAGADPLQRDSFGRLPLHFAANTLDSELITALLEVPNVSNYKLDPATVSGHTPLHALFLPSSELRSPNADLTKCLPFFLERDKNPLGALHAQDKNGLSSLMLVKHLNLKSAFYPFVPPKTFEILLRTVVVPGNIAELLESDFYKSTSVVDTGLHMDDEKEIRRPKLRM